MKMDSVSEIQFKKRKSTKLIRKAVKDTVYNLKMGLNFIAFLNLFVVVKCSGQSKKSS
jgi:hypothetical protein